MRHQTHHVVHVNIPHHKLKKLAHGHRIQLEHHELQHGPHHLMLHHETHKKLHNSRAHKKGMRIGPLTHDEIMASGALKDIWNSVKSGFNKYVKPVLSGVGDAIAYANPELAPIREGVRQITGVGIGKKHHGHHGHHGHRVAKGSEAAKKRMAAVRAAKKKHAGGSFLLY